MRAVVRASILLKNEGIIIEVKKTRATLKAKDIGSELLIDSQRYRSHPDCKKAAVFCVRSRWLDS